MYSKNNLKVINGVLTFSTLSKVLTMKGRVLHIASHGYGKSLLFEKDNDDCGQGLGIDIKELVKMFKDNNNYKNVKLVVVAACLSGKICKALADIGVPYLIP